jgi:hypothetical protein
MVLAVNAIITFMDLLAKRVACRQGWADSCTHARHPVNGPRECAEQQG